VTRGELVAVALSGDYGKPRPALIVQAEHFAALPSVTVLPLRYMTNI
jgi:mRNA interferase MazF